MSSRKQKDLYTALQKEHTKSQMDGIRKEEVNAANHQSPLENNMDLAALQMQATRYMKYIDSERKKIDEMDNEIIKYQAKILDQNTRLGGVHAATQNQKLIGKQIKVLDNRMDKSLTQFNTTVAQNKLLRQQIDEFRRERVVFDLVYKKLETSLHEKKREMSAIIEDSKNAYQARDKSQQEVTALQNQAEKERKAFEQEFKELGQLVKEQQLLIEKLRLEEFDRNTQTNSNVSKTRALKRNISSRRPQLDLVGVYSVGNSEDSERRKALMTHEEMLVYIQEQTGVKDMNEIVEKFLDAENHNFSLFAYINEVSSEIETQEAKNLEMKQYLQKHRTNKGSVSTDQTQRNNVKKDLEEKVNKTEKKTEDVSKSLQGCTKTLSALKNGVQSIFGRIGAQDEVLLNQGVTESNIMDYLGIIEQRASEILNSYAIQQAQLQKDVLLQLPGTQPVKKKDPVTINPPESADVSSGEDSEGEKDERPLTRLELEKRTLKDLSRFDYSKNDAKGRREDKKKRQGYDREYAS